MTNKVAKAYADALFDIAVDEGKCIEYREMIQGLKETMEDDFIRLMSHPQISKDEKKACIDEVYQASLPVVLIHFLKVLIDKNRFQCVKSICDEFDLDYIHHFNILQASVVSARKLNADEKKQLEQKLKNKYKENVECSYEVDASLLAGLRVRVGDTVMDNTALNRLVKLKDRLSG